VKQQIRWQLKLSCCFQIWNKIDKS